MELERTMELIKSHTGTVIKPLLQEHEHRLDEHKEAINRLVEAVGIHLGIPVEGSPDQLHADLSKLAEHHGITTKADWLAATMAVAESLAAN